MTTERTERIDVLAVLHELQDRHGYLPQEALEALCRQTGLNPARVDGVASFYDMFRRKPRGKRLIRVCHGTACHVGGAERVEDALRLKLGIPKGTDTDAAGNYTIETVACLGCCTLAPVIRVDEETIGHVSAEHIYADIEKLSGSKSLSNEEPPIMKGNGGVKIQVGLGSCCMAKGSDRLFAALNDEARRSGTGIAVKRVGCTGLCHRTPMVEVSAPGRPAKAYAGLKAEQAHALAQEHFRGRGPLRIWDRLLDSLSAEQPRIEGFSLSREDPGVRAFFDKQVHIATEHFGKLDPLDLDEYLEHDGFAALRERLKAPPAETIAAIEKSGLRGRGGAGFPSGRKWRAVAAQKAEQKYVICNGDEGDPGAFMDRMLLESFPYRVMEGLAIAAVAAGSHDAIFYIRHEYPVAVRRVAAAIREMEARGWLGERLLGENYALRMTIREGAGAFVCGEETALIASIEGRRGMPRLRPPFPAEEGLWGKPTLINNVETLALVPWIFRNGAEKFAAHGTVGSTGTKVFALAGKVKRGGLIEVPMGTTIREIVEEIGGGAPEGRRFKVAQIGGPSGGCVPARLADTPIDYESLREVGAIMGSGGIVVLDDETCMVDMAKYFLQFTQQQSCGKCSFCRVGTRRMLDIMERLCGGKGRREDLVELETLARQVSAGSLCGLGKSAPNPVLSTLKYYRDEYEAHARGRCPAGKCTALIKYQVNAKCTGCTICAQRCPVHAIGLRPYARHEIDNALCTRCDTCRQACPYGAIEIA